MNHFDAAYIAAAPFLLAVAGFKCARSGKYRHSLPGKLGAYLPRHALPPHRERVWLHGASVGETRGVAAVLDVLQARFPEWEYLVTTTTETGQRQARQTIEGAQHFDYSPFDFTFTVNRFLDTYRPTLHLFFEAEIWPNTLLACGRRGMPTFFVNGCIRERSARWYRAARGLFRKPLSAVTAHLVQTPLDAARMRALVGDRAHLHVTGNVKLDNLPAPLSAETRADLRRAWGATDDDLVIVAGSTHAGEETLIYAAFAQVRRAFPRVRLVVAPRHPERFGSALDDLTARGATVDRLSRGPSDAPVLLFDQMGTLASAWGAADIAVVGGSWAPVGGHNLLEPAAHALPVVHGPGMHGQVEIMRLVGDTSLPVAPRDLAATLGDLCHDSERRHRLGQRAREVACASRGAARRTVDTICEYLP